MAEMRSADFHTEEALKSYASKKWHGKGCKRRNCGSVCLCGPCHARVALDLREQARQKKQLEYERSHCVHCNKFLCMEPVRTCEKCGRKYCSGPFTVCSFHIKQCQEATNDHS